MSLIQYFSNDDEKREFLEKSKIDSDTIIKIGSTSYDVKDKWIKMAARFFEIDTDNTPIDEEEEEDLIHLLKAGLFGYINEINAHEIKNAVYHRNILYDEFFLNTASLSKSIYNYAKLYNIPMEMATPANFKVDMVIRKEDLLKLPAKEVSISANNIDKTRSLKTFEVKFDKMEDFSIGEFKYSLPYDVSIILKQFSVIKGNKEVIDYKVSAHYNVDNKLFKFSSFLDNNIKVKKNINNGEDFYYFSIDLYQITSTTKEFQITNNDLSKNIYLTASYNDQLAGFNVYYEYLGKKTPLETYFNNNYTPDTKNPFCYFNFKETNELEITFSSLNNSFRPLPNSKIIIECITTKGSKGNFVYNTNSFYNIDSKNSFEKIMITIIPKGNSVNGKDKPTIYEEKNKIINNILTRDNLITDFDLDNYFNNVNSTNNINNSFIKFLKKRNDLYTRVYNSFLLLRDSNNKVIPTNTAPYVEFPKSYFTGNTTLGNEQDGYVLPENSLFKYDYTTKKFVHIPLGLANRIEKEKFEKDKDSLYYVNPFLVKINKYPFLSTNYYKVHANDDLPNDYSYINNLIPNNITTSDISLIKLNDFKNTLESDTFKFSIEIGVDSSLEEIRDVIKVRAVLLSQETGEKYGYFDMFPEIENVSKASDNFDDRKSIYSGMISTDRKFKNNRLSITDSLYDTNGHVIDNVFVDEKLVLKVGILYKDNDSLYSESKDNNSEKLFFADEFPASENLKIGDFTLACTMETFNGFSIYQNMSNIMSSTISINDKACKVELVPLFELDYFMNNYEEVYRILDGYKDILETAIPKLENNTEVDMKFYNTKGPSKNFYIDSTMNNDNVTNNFISRTDILLDLNITLYAPITDSLDYQIKKYISDFIEACNEKGIVPISNLIRLLEENFDIIKYIVFNGMSGKYSEKIDNHYQKLLNTNLSMFDLNKQDIIEYVPEFINIKKQLKQNKVEVNSDNNETVIIDLGLTYDDVINITYSIS